MAANDQRCVSGFPGFAQMLATGLLLTAALACGTCAPAEPQAEAADKYEVAEAVNRFALDLYRRLSDANSGQNLFFSPVSVYVTLAMMRSGASGETGQELDRILGPRSGAEHLMEIVASSPPQSDAAGGGQIILLANALWVPSGMPLRESFRKHLDSVYDAHLDVLDWQNGVDQALRKINQWISDRTAGEIVDAVPPAALDGTPQLLLTNGVYFEGYWQSPFARDLTRKQVFHGLSGQSFEVDMMRQRNTVFRYLDEARFSALELPYIGERLSMVVLLPKGATPLSVLESTITPERLAEWLDRLERALMDEVAIPRLDLDEKVDLGMPLRKLGITSLFSAEADLPDITGRSGVGLCGLMHAGRLRMDELGTIAAGATGGWLESVLVHPLRVFRADRPFLFMIRDRETGLLLFLGRVTGKPSWFHG